MTLSTILKISSLTAAIILFGCQPIETHNADSGNHEHAATTANKTELKPADSFYQTPKNHNQFYELLKTNNCFPFNVSGNDEGISTETTTQGRGNVVRYNVSHLKLVTYDENGLIDTSLHHVEKKTNDYQAGDILVSNIPIIYICTRSKRNIVTNYLYVDFYIGKEQLKGIYSDAKIDEMKHYPKQTFKFS
ncbi:hypothetical protein HCY52_08180 [Acinetobacter radioresistens]|uniref:hypothetical protein n=1 Tax=Acinetobacter radioresistens TaxID=40216 RepID=UPI002002ED0D|nr:hypothetical protein [Acinetobacter radioresistens]MCK4083792.1 hypothetical protein [Acinetobacter radioresistens]